ncbi:hypothetical protein CGH20_23590, partial [Vibrio parahaemolyticus]
MPAPLNAALCIIGVLSLNKEFVNERELSLDEWVRLVKIPADERDFKLIDFQFPSDAHRDEYLRTIS